MDVPTTPSHSRRWAQAADWSSCLIVIGLRMVKCLIEMRMIEKKNSIVKYITINIIIVYGFAFLLGAPPPLFVMVKDMTCALRSCCA